MRFKQIVLWGHKIHTHTSSYIHYGYKKAFLNLGYDVLWLDNEDDVSSFNFDNSLFITEGQVDCKIPINKSSYYILHNTRNWEKYERMNKLNLQIYHKSMNDKDKHVDQHSTFVISGAAEKINDYTYLTKDTLYQPWATDLLPNEINLNDTHNETDKKTCVWVGTYGNGDSDYQNGNNLNPFFNECKINGIETIIVDPWASPVSPEQNRNMINKSYLAPSIQGQWQVDVGYSPHCRIMKNISYGHIGITNNKHTNEIFNNELVFDSNIKTLFYKSLEIKQNPKIINKIKSLMMNVKKNHTFINRAEQILKVI